MAVPLIEATETAVNPVPVMVVLKTPSGSWPFDPTAVMTGVGGISVTVAVAVPFAPSTVTVSVPHADRVAGAV